MESKRVKASRIILLAVAALAILIGVVILFGEGVFLRREFQGTTGMDWFSFKDSYPEVAVYILSESSEIGVLILDLGITALIVTLMAYGRKGRWPWYLLLASHTLGLGGVTFSNISTRATGVIMISVVLLALSYIGLALGAGHILRKSPA
jgi:hypothetical protein